MTEFDEVQVDEEVERMVSQSFGERKKRWRQIEKDKNES